MRINKYLAHEKHSTRRGADELIKKGQVFINNRLAVLGDKVNETDKVEVRFRGKPAPYIYLAYNKPRGVPTEEISVKDVFPIGRLDKDSHGLIILTNDGRITEGLLSPEYEHEKEYLVSTKEKLRGNFKDKMEAGVQIENDPPSRSFGVASRTKPCKVKIIDDHTFKVILTEGKKHQIRRMCVTLFQEVDDLERIRIMNIELGKLASGQYREIKDDELQTFLHSLELA